MVSAQEVSVRKPTNLGELLIPEPLFVDGIQFGSFGEGKESYATLVEISVLRNWLQRFPVTESKRNSRDVNFNSELFVRSNCLATIEHERPQPFHIGDHFVLIGSQLYEIKLENGDEFGVHLNAFLVRYRKFKEIHRKKSRLDPSVLKKWHDDAEKIAELEFLGKE